MEQHLDGRTVTTPSELEETTRYRLGSNRAMWVIQFWFQRRRGHVIKGFSPLKSWPHTDCSWVASASLPPCGASWLSDSVRDLQARNRGFDPGLRWICSDVVLLGKALCSHVHSLDPGVGGHLVGQWRFVCLNSSVRRNMAAGLCAPRGVQTA